MANRVDKRGRHKGVERYVALPLYLLRSRAWLGLSLAGRAAFVEALAFYRGDNNGYIMLPVRTLAERIGTSKDTVSRALVELEDKGFIECVFIGSFRRKDRKASEYRITLYQCDRDHSRGSKKFMQWQQSDHRDRTVRPQGHAKQYCRSQSDRKDRQGQNGSVHSPTTETQIDTMGVGTDRVPRVCD